MPSGDRGGQKCPRRSVLSGNGPAEGGGDWFEVSEEKSNVDNADHRQVFLDGRKVSRFRRALPCTHMWM